MTWEDGSDLLGEDGRLWLDRPCTGNIVGGAPCKNEWKFFNLDGAGEEGSTASGLNITLSLQSTLGLLLGETMKNRG